MNLFIDIETATLFKPNEFEKKSKTLYDIWVDRVAKEENPTDFYKAKGPIYAEFSQVICVSVGVDTDDGVRVKSIYQSDLINEKQLLEELKKLLDHDKFSRARLIGHNILGFDIPFLVKRYLANGITLPKLLRLGGLKPREVNVEDTLRMWKSTGVMGASLGLICEVLGLDNPKLEVDGSDTSGMFFDGKYDEIAKYCEGDVIATKGVYDKLVEMGFYLSK